MIRTRSRRLVVLPVFCIGLAAGALVAVLDLSMTWTLLVDIALIAVITAGALALLMAADPDR